MAVARVPQAARRDPPQAPDPGCGDDLDGGALDLLVRRPHALSQNALYDSILSIGIFILLYYGMTGLACVVYFRRELTKSVRHFLLVGVVPLVGAIVMTYILVKSVIDLSKPENSESGASWLGLGPPLVIAIGFMVLGVLLMLWRCYNHREFFWRPLEVADPAVLDA